MAKSSKYTRARIRARGRRGRRRGGTSWFYAAIAMVVVVGVVLIVVSRSSTADVPPQPGNPATGEAGDHWHDAFAVNICGEWLSAPAEFEQVADNPNVTPGIHTHGDGFIHIHPHTKSEGGENATLGRFLDYGGWGASEDSIDLGEDQTKWVGLSADPSKRTWSDGDKCPAGTEFAEQKGVVKWSIDCKERDGNPSDYKLENGVVVALAFLPKDEPIGVPPNASEAPSDDGSTEGPLNVKACTTEGPGGDTATTTTIAGAATATPESTTPTTAATTDTTTTPAS
jgi:hypothetical protein